MRKGSKKLIIDKVEENGISTTRQFSNEHAINILECSIPVYVNPVNDILLRLCDACHDMDTKTEPWASIRKDIENLR